MQKNIVRLVSNSKKPRSFTVNVAVEVRGNLPQVGDVTFLAAEGVAAIYMSPF